MLKYQRDYSYKKQRLTEIPRFGFALLLYMTDSLTALNQLHAANCEQLPCRTSKCLPALFLRLESQISRASAICFLLNRPIYMLQGCQGKWGVL